MRIIKTTGQWRAVRRGLEKKGLSIGFVPTMGALHEGHASLVRRSAKENDITLVSVFVNPTQFNDKNDLGRYPRTPKKDAALLEKCGADYLLAPDFEELYPDGYRYRVSENRDSLALCGAHRPGHFDGVLTVVMKLLNISGADRAYFGEKDYQQYMLVKGMAEAFFMRTRIVPCKIVREADGLALSSRNRLLPARDRERAPLFHRHLSAGANAIQSRRMLEKEGFAVDYVEEKWGRRLAAINLGGVRLIDNVEI